LECKNEEQKVAQAKALGVKRNWLFPDKNG